MGLLGGSVIKNPPASERDAREAGLVLGWGRSPGVGNGNLLQYSCLENPMGRGRDEYEVRESKGRLEPMKMNLISCWFLSCFQFQRCGYYAYEFDICITDPVCDASCLAVSHCVHCLLNPR